MEIIANTTDFNLNRETAVAIGKFDGVHIGHRRLLEEILKQKQQGLAAVVFTFDPPPSVYFGSTDGKVLTTREEKRVIFEQMGVDTLIEFPLNAQTAAMDAQKYVEQVLVDQMKVRFVAAGSDLSFGAKGAGDGILLQKMGRELGFCVQLIDKVCFGEMEVSSTYVRSQVEAGNMLLTQQLLGMPYTFWGKVVHGNRIGRTLGMPTVNLQPQQDKLIPPFGVYFSHVIYGGNRYKAISNVGYKPTVTQERILGVESYLYEFRDMIYGEDIQVSLLEYRRPEYRFDSLEALKAQLVKDIQAGSLWKR